MKRKLLILFGVALIVGAISGTIYYLVKGRAPTDELLLYGNVDVRQVDIGFRVPGQVAELFYEEGDLVPAGALMARLDSDPYDSKVLEAAADVQRIKAELVNAEKHLFRREELVDEGGVSEEELGNALARRNALAASLDQAEAALRVALDNLSYTEVYAPNEGILLTRIREPGTAVRETDPVYTLSLTHPIWVRAYVDEPHLGQVFFGMAAEVFTDTPGAPTYTGRVGFISPIAEFTPKTVQTTSLRTDLVYRLRVYVDSPDRYLKQGMPVTIRLKTGETGG